MEAAGLIEKSETTQTSTVPLPLFRSHFRPYSTTPTLSQIQFRRHPQTVPAHHRLSQGHVSYSGKREGYLYPNLSFGIPLLPPTNQPTTADSHTFPPHSRRLQPHPKTLPTQALPNIHSIPLTSSLTTWTPSSTSKVSSARCTLRRTYRRGGPSWGG